MTAIKQCISVTGFILFVMGLVTLTPEIYLSGVIVMFTSAGLQLNAIEAQRIEESRPHEQHISAENYYSW